MNSKALLMAAAAILALSAVSCGKNDDTEDSVSISLSDEVTATKNTSETTTATESAVTSAVSETVASTEVSTAESLTTTAETSTDAAAEVTTAAAETSQAEETTQPAPTEQSAENNAPTEAPQETAQVLETPFATDAPPQSDQPDKVRFSMDSLLSDASGIVSGLGNPDYTGGGAACLTNGHDDKIYQYDGLEIQCYIDGDIEYIFQITITGGDYETDKGIKIGSTRTDVEAAYGTGTPSGNMIIYSSGSNEMDIQYNDDDTVKSIFFYTPV